jgi:acyl-CoA thioesterase FadM
MAYSYKWRFTVRTYEAGGHRYPSPVTLANFLEEAAAQGSAYNGFDTDWYFANGLFWVVKHLSIRYYQPLRIAEPLEMETWIGNMKRVSSHREYRLRRADSDEIILRARHNWVMVDAQTMRPVRIPTPFSEKFIPDQTHEPIETGLADPLWQGDGALFRVNRKVEADEIDRLKHVNNAVYVRWIENAIAEHIGTLPKIEGLERIPHSRETEYIRSATADDPITVYSRLVAHDEHHLTFSTEIQHGISGEVFIQDQVTYTLQQSSGSALCRVPAEWRAALIHANP